jgi:hypothetical protein
MKEMQFVYNDGGREAAGFKGKNAGDCVTRAVAIATGQPYTEVYAALAGINAGYRGRKANGRRTARNGVWVKSKAFKDYMRALGWQWTPTMLIGSGCKVHLIASELPKGRLIVSVSRHYTTVIDGVIHDTYNPQRGSTVWYKTGGAAMTAEVERISPDRCVYGYWSKAA